MRYCWMLVLLEITSSQLNLWINFVRAFYTSIRYKGMSVWNAQITILYGSKKLARRKKQIEINENLMPWFTKK